VIRVQCPATAPAVLSKGHEETARWVTDVRAHPAAHRAGAKKVTFDETIYRDPSVKQVLVQAQHEKCAFCESNFARVSYGDVEHFRPKGGIRQRRRGALRRPGYYWLAYVWENLLVSCELCNRRFKRNWFPLEHRSTRVRGPKGDLSRERPLLVNPAVDDPAASITFHEHRAVAVAGAPRGRSSIRGYGLNRRTLLTARRRVIDAIEVLLDAIEELPGDHPTVIKAEDFLRRMTAASEEYSAMVRAYLNQRRSSVLPPP
jgi:uncharacterized protein (TIGR02646 family)